MAENLFEVNDLKKWYAVRHEGIIQNILKENKYLKAIDNISFNIEKGEFLGLAGQSGCGKSTLGEIMVHLQQPTGGEILFENKDISKFSKEEMREFRQKCQVIFQDPYESVNPRLTAGQWVREPLSIHSIGDGEERDARVYKALSDAGLSPPEKFIDKLPSELSGGERQRICIARALVLDPIFVVADEPVSMLDVSVKTKILKLLKSLQEERNLTLLYISHDMSSIRYLSDRTMIMYLGKLVETGPTEAVIHSPTHPYTENLIDSVPEIDPGQKRKGSGIEGDVPDPVDLPTGCRFAPRCGYVTDECRESEPNLEETRNNQFSACYHPIQTEHGRGQ